MTDSVFTGPMIKEYADSLMLLHLANWYMYGKLYEFMVIFLIYP